jgi:hypothetical protein
MKKIACIISVLLCAAVSCLHAQDNDVIPLLNAYDYLFFNRTNDSYTDSSKRTALFKEAEKTARFIMNDAALKKNYPTLHNRYFAEYYYLATLIKLDSNKNRPYTQLLPALDTAINWYNNHPEEEKDSAAADKIIKVAGIRAASVTYSNKALCDALTDRYNAILLHTLQQQLKDYSATQHYNFVAIDTVFKLHKLYKQKRQDNYSSDSVFQSMLKIYAYFRVLEEARARHCDSLLYYYTWYKALKTVAPATQDMPALSDTITNCNKDSLYLASLEDAIYDKLSPLSRGAEMPAGMAPFPWPPPEPSSRSQPLNFKAKNINTLADANGLLVNALSQANYSQFDYYYVPNGFALVTPLEQIQTDGTPKGDPPRWNVKAQLSEDFSFMNYLKALFMGEKGYYRIIVFVVTDKPFSFIKSNTTFTIQNLPGGINGLPPELGEQPYTSNHKCTVLVYEFEKQNSGDATSFVKPGRYSVQTHLKKTLVWQNLFE